MVFETPEGFVLGYVSYGCSDKQTVPAGEVQGVREAAKLYTQWLLRGNAPPQAEVQIAIDASYVTKGWWDPTRRTAGNALQWHLLDKACTDLGKVGGTLAPIKCKSHLQRGQFQDLHKFSPH